MLFVFSHCRAVLFSGWQEVVTMENISAAKTMKDVAHNLESVTLAPGDLITLSFILKMLSEKHTRDLQHSQTPLSAFEEAHVSLLSCFYLPHQFHLLKIFSLVWLILVVISCVCTNIHKKLKNL